MKRRDFIRLNVAAVGTGLMAPQLRAETEPATSATSDLYYTKASPGRWSDKVATHLPTVEVSKTTGKVVVKVVTPHEMKGYAHYIVKHVLLDSRYKFLDEHLFDPMTEKVPLSTFTLNDYSGTLYVLSLCNRHDLWLTAVDV